MEFNRKSLTISRELKRNKKRDKTVNVTGFKP